MPTRRRGAGLRAVVTPEALCFAPLHLAGVDAESCSQPPSVSLAPSSWPVIACLGRDPADDHQGIADAGRDDREHHETAPSARGIRCRASAATSGEATAAMIEAVITGAKIT